MDFPKLLTDVPKKVENKDLDNILAYTVRQEVINLAGGLPDPSVFPHEQLRDIAERVLKENFDKALQYSPATGVPEFKKEIVSYLSRGLGITGITEDQILVSSGSQEALFALAMTTVSPGDYVFTENPTYYVAVSVFRAFDSVLSGAPIVKGQLNVDLLEGKVKETPPERRKLVYVMPNAQNPTGASMSEETKKHLLEVAERYDLTIVEDDPYSLINYEGKTPRPLKAMDKENRVIYMSTMSKVLAPGLRLGWMVADPYLVKAVTNVKQVIDLNTNTLSQYVAAYALKSRVIENNLENVRRVYTSKRNAMVDELSEVFKDKVEFVKPESGMFVFALFKGVNTRTALEKAIANSVLYLPGDSLYVSDPQYNSARLNFTYPSEDKIREGVRRLKKTFY
ncbi:aminotransferase [Sulfodiicoccus acidiphilus]|uniref:Aminotransferase n=1 Tax=Sulfodiicoccus acidiphilus TaxID=1670455 RepID=A0A348B266_9CREN|nr:PLP-dependent aminotransferase family protein [Sulfodiicoccus acidiphilus]BBD72268.1 aminotransferase [Sulfodiicoccus acidiphilus]GGT90660.1 aminotransferase [Sulfodiicoccus acidiphilus]